MKFFSLLSLKKKLFLLFAVSILFILPIIIIGMAQMLWLKRSAMTIYDETVTESQNVMKVRTGMEQARRALFQLILERDKSRQERALADLQDSTMLVDGALMILSSERFDVHLPLEIERLRGTWEDFKNTRDMHVIPTLLAGKQDEALLLAMNLQEQRFRDFTAVVQRLIDHSNSEAASAQEQIESTFHKTIMLYSAISLAGLFMAVFSILYISRDINSRFSKVLEGISRFHSGERLVRIDVSGKDEIGVLRDTMNRLFEQIHEDMIAQEQYVGIINWEKDEKDRKGAELEKSREIFRNLIETTSDWVWEIDENGMCMYASPKVFDVLGYTPEEVIGKTPFDFMPPDEAERVNRIFVEYSRNQKPFVNLESMNTHKDGHTVILESSGTPYFYDKGFFAGYRGISRDITSRKMAEKEKASLAEHLTQTEKLASIGQLAAGVAHEINNPLGYVSSNLNTLSEYIENLQKLLDLYGELSRAVEKGDFEDIVDYREQIERFKRETDFAFATSDARQALMDSSDGISRINAIVKGLKDFSYSGGGESENHDLNNCINDALRIGRSELKDKAETVLDLCEGINMRCRPQQLTQVFLNIIVNAAQALERNGRIIVRTFKVGGNAIVEIIDNGTGMSDDIKKRIFDPFFTTKPVGKGTGLGLSIAYSIVKEHGGSLDVESQPGKGTRFMIKLPADTGEVAVVS